MDTRNFEVLFTHQKQKKKKTWQDGNLKVSCNGTKAVLYDDQRNLLELFHIQSNKVSTGSDIECDRYLINIGDEQNVEEKSNHSIDRVVPARSDGKAAGKHAVGATASMGLSFGKRKREHAVPTAHYNNTEEVTTRDRPWSTSHQGGTSNPRNRISEEPSWCLANNGMDTEDQDYPKAFHQSIVSCAPPQKRNRKELLSLFSSKPLAKPTLGKTLKWNKSLTQGGNCFKGFNSSNIHEEMEMPLGHHDFLYCQNRKKTNQRINNGGSCSQISADRLFLGSDKSHPPCMVGSNTNQPLPSNKTLFTTATPSFEFASYRGPHSNVFQGLDCSLEDAGEFGDGFVDMAKPAITVTKSLSLPAANTFSSNVFQGLDCSLEDTGEFGDGFIDMAKPAISVTNSLSLPVANTFSNNNELSYEVVPDASEFEDVDFESDINDEILFDICPRFDTSSDRLSCKTKEQTWTVETPIDHTVSYHSECSKGFPANNTVEREPLNCGKRTAATATKSSSFTPPILSLIGRESNSSQLSFSGELYFPSDVHCTGSVTPTRKVNIPTKFGSVMEYKQILKSALREHLNIVLFQLAQTYHGILAKVDIASSSDSLSAGMCIYHIYPQKTIEIVKSRAISVYEGQKGNIKGPSCSHGPAKLRAVKKDGSNKGRHFYNCPGSGSNQCKFFKWADDCRTGSSSGNKKLPLTSSDSIRVYFRSKGVHFYHDCLLERRTRTSYARKSFRGRQRHSRLDNQKKSMYIVLKYKESSSSYSKDDIWIVSKTLNFEPCSTFVAKSLFYGPSSSGDVEVEPVSGYSPSNWRSGDSVHAIWVCNAGTELSCMKNMEDHVTSQQMPLLPYLLNGSQPSFNSSRVQRPTFTAPLTSINDRNTLGISWTVIEEETEKMVVAYNLNKDQAAALYSCAKMFLSEEERRERPPITLIHGVFGAGKSFLLAVVVILMVKLFEMSDDISDEAISCRQSSQEWKILISSTTNVAVDRILVGLLDLGFDQFVRVGSLRKIAAPVLPFSIHSVGTESQELKELQAMLKGDLTSSDKSYVRKSIERHKLGENRKRLSSVRVVGVTCAACVFPSLERLKFPVLLLDECSQMTEPTSLLPLARFGCRKLVLVGDPKQLNPTIQGSEPEHETGLEQTLFDRLIKMNFEPILLRTQYRCHPRISSISNRLFYDNNLLNGVTSDERQPLVNFVPTLCFYDVSKGREQYSQDGSYFNQNEANFVVVLIKSLLESQVAPTQIGVITQYKSQLTTISNSLMPDGETSSKELKGIQISTVDAFQGGEKAVIILSCVRTQHVGFIDCKRRTNVAVTRAKRHLCIVGCGRMLSSNTLWGKIITFCRETPNGVQCSETFIREWNEKRPALCEDTSNKSKRSKEKGRPSKGNVTKLTVQPESDFPSNREPTVSTLDICFVTENIETSISDNNTMSDAEIQEIVPDKEQIFIDKNNEVLSSEFECFDALLDDDLPDYSSIINA